ncbi:MAG TPA: phosphoglucosamine mutase [Acidobacteriota bacterium]|nr:phosphoglucosamine mutase [Acidobacteriota bacterium]
MNSRPILFGTDGIRARAGHPPLDGNTLSRLGAAVGTLFGGRILIGRDTRASGPWIENILCRALRSSGSRPKALGVISTPAVSYLTREDSEASAGVVISASHNPFYDNGLKIFGPDGEKLPDHRQHELEAAVGRLEEVPAGPGSAIPELQEDGQEADLSRLLTSDQPSLRRYLDFLASAAAGHSLTGLKIVLDCANGAAYRSAPRLLTEMGAEVVALGADPDGRNINSRCGALHPQAMAERVRREGAHMGAAFDGDADRIILSDETGRLLDGDYVLLMLARQMDAQGRLPKRAIVSTVMSNLGLEKALSDSGIHLLRTPVGDRFVWEAMKKGGHPLGGEQSGHIILSEMLPSGDGQLIAVKVAALLASSGRPLSKLAESMVRHPQLLLNVPVASKPEWKEIPSLSREVERVERELDSRGRVLVRYSGTEPKIRIMLEAEPGLDLEPPARRLAECFRRELGG